MRRRLKTGAVFLFLSGEKSPGFFFAQKYFEKLSEVRNNLRFSHCSLCEGERKTLYIKEKAAVGSLRRQQYLIQLCFSNT